jgi:hypothetical protein
MASFKKAFKVTKNTKTLSEQHNALAEAFNSRILSGIGDCAWRIFYYAYSTFRGLRNPNGNDYPPQDEWFKFYAYMEPKSTYGRFGWLKLQQESQKEQIIAIPSWHGFSATIQESGKLTGKEILLKIEFMGFGQKP